MYIPRAYDVALLSASLCIACDKNLFALGVDNRRR